METNGNGHKPKPRARRNYSDREKAAALAALDFHKGNLLATSKALGVPIATLSAWRDGQVNQDVSELRNEKKADLAELVEKVIVAALEAKVLSPSSITTLDAAILIDKLLLLRGLPNAISQQTSADPEKRQARILHLVRKAGGE